MAAGNVSVGCRRTNGTGDVLKQAWIGLWIEHVDADGMSVVTLKEVTDLAVHSPGAARVPGFIWPVRVHERLRSSSFVYQTLIGFDYQELLYEFPQLTKIDLVVSHRAGLKLRALGNISAVLSIDDEDAEIPMQPEVNAMAVASIEIMSFDSCFGPYMFADAGSREPSWFRRPQWSSLGDGVQSPEVLASLRKEALISAQRQYFQVAATVARSSSFIGTDASSASFAAMETSPSPSVAFSPTTPGHSSTPDPEWGRRAVTGSLIPKKFIWILGAVVTIAAAWYLDTMSGIKSRAREAEAQQLQAIEAGKRIEQQAEAEKEKLRLDRERLNREMAAAEQVRLEADAKMKAAEERALAALPSSTVAGTVAPTEQVSAMNSAPEQQAGRISLPRLAVGDRWVFRTEDKVNPAYSNTVERKIVALSSGGFVQTSRNLKSNYTRRGEFTQEWAVIATSAPKEKVTSWDPPYKYHEFPITPLTKWSGRSKRIVEDSSEAQETHTSEAVVGGWEEVTVPAGKFWCVRVSRKAYTFVGNEIVVDAEDVSYYSPKAKRSVRTTESSVNRKTGQRGVREIELLEYSLISK